MTITLDGTSGITSPAETVQGALTTTGNTILGDASTDTLNVGNGGLVKDASGNVGIGTASPAQKLDIASKVQIDTANSYGKIKIARATDSGVAALYIQGADNAGTANELSLVNAGGGGAAINITGGDLRFYESSNTTERMRIDSAGVVKINRTTNSSRATTAILQILMSNSNNIMSAENTNATPYGIDVYYSGAAPNNANQSFYDAADTGGARFAARSNGGIANYSANNANLSDRREKTNFAPAGEYLSKICAIPVQTFNYIDQNMEEDGGLTLGVVAQDVQDVAPEMVMESNWGTEEEPKMRLSIYQTDLQYALMKCIQEQQALITQLQADVAALKALSA